MKAYLKRFAYFILIFQFSVALFVPFPKVVHAAQGDIAVYTESSGLDLIGTSVTDIDWDTTNREDGVYTLEPNNIDLRVSQSGHYLVMYSVPTESASGNNSRSEIQSWLRINDATDSRYGRGQGYIRRSGSNFEGYNQGAAVLDLSASDILRLQMQRTDSTSSTVRRRPGNSGISLVKLDESWDYLRTYPSANQSITGTFTDLALDTDDEIDAGTFSRSGGDITLGSAGHYLVIYNIGASHTSGTRANAESRLTLDGTEIDGTLVTTYMRGTTSTQDGMLSYAGIIETTSASQVLSVEFRKESTGTPAGLSTKAAESGVTIVKLPDTADYIRLTEAGGGQDLSTAVTDIDWDTTDEVDSGSFSYSGVNPSRVEIDAEGDYLFFHSLYASRVSSGIRESQWLRWRENGSDIFGYGSSGAYNRGDQGSADAYASGSSAGIVMPSLDATDYIELIQQNEAANGPSTYQGGRMGLQGVRIDTLFGSIPNVEQLHYQWRDDSTVLNTSGGFLAAEDTDPASFDKNVTYRLRLEVANTGTAIAAAQSYELQFGELGAGEACENIGTWTGIEDSGADAFEMSNTAQITDGETVTPGLLANTEAYSFTAGFAQDVSDTTASIGPLSLDTYTEVEYAFLANNNVSSGTTYCFRLLDTTSGETLDDIEFAQFTWTNSAPDAPTTVTPVDASAITDTTPDVTSSAFSDPDSGDTHTDTVWEIATDAGFGDIVWSRTAGSGEVTTTVNDSNGTFSGSLAGNTELDDDLYYLRITHEDNNGATTTSTNSTFTVDTVAPLAFAITVDITGIYDIDNPSIMFATTDALSGIDRYEVDVDGGGFSVQTAPYTPSLTPASSHTVTVRAYDVAGNFTEEMVMYPPAVNITAPTIISNTTITDTTIVVSGPNDITSITPSGAGFSGLSCDKVLPATSPVSCTISIGSTGTLSVTAEDTSLATGSTSQDYVIETDAPDVTINQSGSQDDPTNSSPVTFLAVFSESINEATFTTTDIDTSSSTATGISIDSITEIAPNDDTTFEISISATGDGTVVATIPALSVTDLAGNGNNVSTSTDNSVTLDIDDPDLLSFTSTSTDGSYGQLGTVNVTATYDENVASGSTLTVVLDNGESVVLSTISTDTISGTYTVGTTGSGEDSTDLTVASISSESVSDSSGNTQTGSTVPLAPNNIADTSDIVIDVTGPVLAEVTAVTDPTNDATPDYEMSSNEDAAISFSGSCQSATISVTSGNTTIALDADGAGTALVDGTYTDCEIMGQDTVDFGASNTSSSSLSISSFEVDTVSPDVTINQASSQADPGESLPILFTVVFDEPINEATFGTGDIDVSSSTAPGVSVDSITEVAPNDDTTFQVSISATDEGDITATIPAAGISDAAGNTNTISTSTDNVVEYELPSSGGGGSDGTSISFSGVSIEIEKGASCVAPGVLDVTLNPDEGTEYVMGDNEFFIGSSWQSLSEAPFETTFTAEEGELTLYAQFRKNSNLSFLVSDSITVDSSCGDVVEEEKEEENEGQTNDELTREEAYKDEVDFKEVIQSSLPEGVSVHDLIKLPDDEDPTTAMDTTVYYVGADFKRHAFVNEKVFNTWFCGFSDVRIVSEVEMASITLGANVVYQPYSRLIKFSSPEVYAVDHFGILHWVPNEEAAEALYGANWSDQVDDVSDAFFPNYIVGEPLDNAEAFIERVERYTANRPSATLRILDYVDPLQGLSCSDVAQSSATKKSIGSF